MTLWQALCGERPFRGSYVELGRAKHRGPPPWPRGVAGVTAAGGGAAAGLDGTLALRDEAEAWLRMHEEGAKARGAERVGGRGRAE